MSATGTPSVDIRWGKCVRFIPILILVLACASDTTEPESAHTLCDSWNTEGFFKRASPDDIANCLRAGKDVSARNGDQQSPICTAAQYTSDPEVINVLVRHGAQPDDWCAMTGWFQVGFCPNATVLHLAAGYNQNPLVIQALIDAGAQVNAVAGQGWTPLNIAYLWHNTGEVIDLLIRRGAREAEVLDPDMCG